MTELSRLLQERGIDFDPQDSRIMCFPHILNICSKHATNDLASADLTSVSEASFVFPGSNVNKHAYLEAFRRDPIACARDVVRIVRLSSLRRESFKEIILDSNIKKYWRDEECEVVQLPVRELIRNVPTRWDSKYAMAQRLRLYCQVRRDDNSCDESHSPTGYSVVLRVTCTPRYRIVEISRSRLARFRGLGNGPRGTLCMS